MLKAQIDRSLASLAVGCDSNYSDKLCLISIDLINRQTQLGSS
jgi:hypothetical protein